MTEKQKITFSFGQNWLDYSRRIDEETVQQAAASLQRLFGVESLSGRSFLDIGCGSGLFCVAAARLGAGPVVGLDVDPKSVQATAQNAARFSPEASIRVAVGSILDPAAVAALPRSDVVYAWGSLHHTGDMWSAIGSVLGLPAEGGLLSIAIYNKTAHSERWTKVKRFYNNRGPLAKRLMVEGYYHKQRMEYRLSVLKRRLLGQPPPDRIARGMDVYYDVIDWLGGYPYEYATPEEIKSFVAEKTDGALALEREFLVGNAPRSIGCNELVWRRRP